MASWWQLAAAGLLPETIHPIPSIPTQRGDDGENRPESCWAGGIVSFKRGRESDNVYSRHVPLHLLLLH
jgi:hypothetical protein